MKIVAWVCNQSNQKALINKIQKLYPIAAIITETPKSKRKITFKLLFNALIEKTLLRRTSKLWWDTLKYYDNKFPEFPELSKLNVENINSEEAYNFTTALKPDLIIVSGTRMVKSKMLSIQPTIGIINLHTGLSPYIKGGPNCTNWCIAQQKFHLIGNTIMWIDAGIDSGNFLSTEFTPLAGTETLLELHIKVMDHAHQLYCEAIKYLIDGGRRSVPQISIDKGTIYYSSQWNLKQKYLLLKNFKKFKASVFSDNIKNLRKDVTTIPKDAE